MRKKAVGTTMVPILGLAVANCARQQALSPGFRDGICLDCSVAEVKMRMKMLVGVAAGVLMVTASAAEASVGEKDEVAVAVPVEPVASETGIRDEAMMVLVGSALIGAAAAVRRAA